MSEAASQDIDDAYDYVAEFNPDAADRQTDRFQSLFAKLAEMPGIGAPRYDLVEGMRSRGVGRYLIHYQVSADDLIIVRVAHGARDQASLFAELDTIPDQ
ncbi:type II toxin-antitoxin system RelE/ParE family toxin [Sphingomonas ursincola]|uniref:type II toxin-antitoxin system RelE/ParE family toxin n=1 Tax=Sphingomonas ursincola TaxID=56361 RepID=UPI0030CA57FB